MGKVYIVIKEETMLDDEEIKLKCPYCGHSKQKTSGVGHLLSYFECDCCDKKVRMERTEIKYYRYSFYKASCLNGGPHNLDDDTTGNHNYCSTCNVFGISLNQEYIKLAVRFRELQREKDALVDNLEHFENLEIENDSLKNETKSFLIR